ncbi:hypothetical protein ACQ4PT_050947 [Festuca glaucescens]
MVLLPTGELREYMPPATAARVLQDFVEAGPGWFLCNADAMGFDGPVAALSAGNELRPGQIYFVLPAEARRNGLRREDIDALAVRASTALPRKSSTSPLVFAPPAEKADPTAAAYKTVPRWRPRGGRMPPPIAA